MDEGSETLLDDAGMSRGTDAEARAGVPVVEIGSDEPSRSGAGAGPVPLGGAGTASEASVPPGISEPVRSPEARLRVAGVYRDH